jgi:hypothetical protein
MLKDIPLPDVVGFRGKWRIRRIRYSFAPIGDEW